MIPKIDVLRKAYLRAVRINYIEYRLDDLTHFANEFSKSVKVPRDIKTKVLKAIEESDDCLPWDKAIASVVAEISEGQQ